MSNIVDDAYDCLICRHDMPPLPMPDLRPRRAEFSFFLAKITHAHATDDDERSPARARLMFDATPYAAARWIELYARYNAAKMPMHAMKMP